MNTLTKTVTIDGTECVATNEVFNRIGLVTTGKFLTEELGIFPLAEVKNAVYWRLADMDRIRRKMALFVLSGE